MVFKDVVYSMLKIFTLWHGGNVDSSAAGADNAAFLERGDRGGFGLL